ncbi:NELL2-interacting cell ontogeny regulator 1 [Engystomops pustulosus]|uniref:NELL2-interacting cell ontogeny regulator 1 n=1 Tax=Engystomops pustulosus TaxID=76066 RepID=UPI003AFA3CB5
MSESTIRPVIWWLTLVAMAGGTSIVTPTNEKIDGAIPQTGTTILADTRLCVDCHAFEFLERAVQDLYRAAHNLDSQTEILILRTEDRGLCRCLT